jgi:hypothetical protein
MNFNEQNLSHNWWNDHTNTHIKPTNNTNININMNTSAHTQPAAPSISYTSAAAPFPSPTDEIFHDLNIDGLSRQQTGELLQRLTAEASQQYSQLAAQSQSQSQSQSQPQFDFNNFNFDLTIPQLLTQFSGEFSQPRKRLRLDETIIHQQQQLNQQQHQNGTAPHTPVSISPVHSVPSSPIHSFNFYNEPQIPTFNIQQTPMQQLQQMQTMQAMQPMQGQSTFTPTYTSTPPISYPGTPGPFSVSDKIVPSSFSQMDIDSTVTGKDDKKKIKHQLTDRQRRAKIKESMEQLKNLVTIEPNQKADQAHVLAQSVNLVNNLRDEVGELKQKLAKLEIQQRETQMELIKKEQLNLQRINSNYMSSPFSGMMSTLNGAGVSMWRLALDGKILEINLVFELISGWSNIQIRGHSPCSAPLYGTLSVIPQEFLKTFSQQMAVSALSSSNVPSPIPSLHEHSNTSSPNSNDSPSSPNSFHSFSYPEQHEPIAVPNPSNYNNTSHAPLFAAATLSSLPVVKQSELESFFPFKCKTLLEPPHSGIVSSSMPAPHASYLVKHLASLPPQHVLKLLARTCTQRGQMLESITTLALVRTASGAPDYILCLSTPDCRRLVDFPSIDSNDQFANHQKVFNEHTNPAVTTQVFSH